MNLTKPSILAVTQLATLFALQHQCNQILIGEDYLDNPPSNLNFRLASDKEFFESYDHLDYKWWKKGATNKPQFALEMVDCIHFNLSEALGVFNKQNMSIAEGVEDFHKHLTIVTDGVLENFDTVSAQMQAELDAGTDPNRVLLEVVDAHRVAYINATCVEKTFMNFLLAHIAGMDTQQVFTTYVAKNTLNIFRATHGYKDGTYIKNWFGEEDNATIEQYMACIDMSQPDSVDLLNVLLEATYATVVATQA